MRSIWKLPNYISFSDRPKSSKGIIWYDQIGSIRRVYNGKRYARQKIRPCFVWMCSSLFVRSRSHPYYIRRYWGFRNKKRR